MKKMMNWDEVVVRHGSRAAIKYIDGRVCSVLCGGDTYNDKITDDYVEYVIPNRKFYKKSLTSLETAMQQGAAFSVFHKITQNVWRDLGRFRVSSIKQLESEYQVIFVPEERVLEKNDGITLNWMRH